MKLDRGRLKAIALLTLSVLGWLLARCNPLRRRRGDLASFLEQYRDDGAHQVAPADRDAEPARTVCVLCGLCDAIAAEHAAPASPLDHAGCATRSAAASIDRSGESRPSSEVAAAVMGSCPLGIVF